MPPRLRFAPSPTGYLHVGGARTALFNWLYVPPPRRRRSCCASRTRTSSARRPTWSRASSSSLRWLGLDWDEGPGVGGPHAPYFQTERLDRYRAAAAHACVDRPRVLLLLQAGGAAARSAKPLRPQGSPGTYDRTCRGLSDDDIARREAAGEPRAIRFLVAGRQDDLHRSRPRPHRVRPRAHRRLRHPALGRLSHLPPLRRRRRRGDGDHARGARRRPHLEHAEAGAALSRDGRAGARVRARAADSRAGQEAPEQAPRRDVRRRIREARLSARSDGELSRAARLVARRRPRSVHARRARRSCSRSRASAAATPSSIPRSSTGSTSSTSLRLPAARVAATPADGSRVRRASTSPRSLRTRAARSSAPSIS